MHIYLTPSPSPDDNFIDFWTPEFFPLIVEYLRRPSIAAHRWKCLKAGVPDPSRKATKGQEFGARVIEKIVLNLSDQLLLIGSAVLIAGFWTHCSISVYHFALISDLAWFASTCHLTTVAALEKYLRRRPMFRDWRVFLMACMAILLAASTVMQGHRAWYSSWPFNAQCVFDHYVFADVGGLPARWMYTKLVILFIDYPSSIGLLYQPSRDLWKRWLYTKPRELMQSALDRLQQMRSRKATKSFPMATARRVSCAGCIALVKSSRIACSFIYMLTTSLFASRWTNLLVCVAAFIYGLVGRFQDRNIPREKMDSDENLMTFGQIVPILLLSSTILVAREAYEGEYCAVTIVKKRC